MGFLGGKKKTPEARYIGQEEYLTPEQRDLQNKVINRLDTQFADLPDDAINLTKNPLYEAARGNLLEILRPRTDQQLEERFQRQIGEPTLGQFHGEILPSLQQQFAHIGAGRSSALNQAMAQAAQEVSMGLASQREQYLGNQRNQMMSAGQAAQGLAATPLQNTLPLFQPALHRRMEQMYLKPTASKQMQGMQVYGPLMQGMMQGQGFKGGPAIGGAVGSAFGPIGTAAGTFLGGMLGF